MPQSSNPTMTTPTHAERPTGRSAPRTKTIDDSARSVDFRVDLRLGIGSEAHLSHGVPKTTSTTSSTNNFCNLQQIESVQGDSLDGLSLGLAGLTHLHRFAPLAVHGHAATAPNPRAAVAPASVAAPNLSWRRCATSTEAPATADLSIGASEASRNDTTIRNKVNQASGNRSSFPIQQQMSMEMVSSSHFNQQSTTNVSSNASSNVSQQTTSTTSNLRKQRQHLSILMPPISSSSSSSIVTPLELAGQSTNAVAAAAAAVAASIASPSIWSPSLAHPSIPSHAPTPSIFDFTSIHRHSMNFGLDMIHPTTSSTPVQNMHERGLVSPPSMHTDTICPGDLHSTGPSTTIMSRNTSSNLSTQYMRCPVTTTITDLHNPISARVLFGQSMDTMCCTPMPDTTMPSLLISPQSGVSATTMHNNVVMYAQSHAVVNTDTGSVLSTFPVSHQNVHGLRMVNSTYSMPNDISVGATKPDFVYGGASMSDNSSRDKMYMPTTMSNASSSQPVYEFTDLVELGESGMECPWNTNASTRSEEVTDNALVNVPVQLDDDDDDDDTYQMEEDDEETTSKSTLLQKASLKKPNGGYRRRKAPSVIDLTCPDCGTVFARLSALRSHERMHASAKRALEDAKQRSMQQSQMMNMFGNSFVGSNCFGQSGSAGGMMTDMWRSTLHFGIPSTMTSLDELEPLAATTSGMKRPRHRSPAQLQSISFKARSFVCQVCQSSFIRKQDLRRHQSTKHAGGAFTPAVVEAGDGAVIAPSINGIKRVIKCFDCQRTFSRTDALFRHRKSRCKAVVSSTNLVRASDGEEEEE